MLQGKRKFCAVAIGCIALVGALAYLLLPDITLRLLFDTSAPGDQLKVYTSRGFFNNPHNRYYAEKLSCGPGYATIVYGEVPLARYWAVHTNDRWSRSLDGLSDSNITAPGGRFEVRIAPDRGNAENWIPCSALDAGLVTFRTTLAVGNVTPPRLRVEREAAG